MVAVAYVEVKFVVGSIVLASHVIGLALVAGCGTENVPACVDVSWLGSSDRARLTGGPSFSASEIAPGDSLAISVPVDVNARAVRVWISAHDQTQPGSSGGARETDGGEAVDIRIENTSLPGGVYLAGRIELDGDIAPKFAQYIATNSGAPYVLSVSPAAESRRSCVTDILAPTFSVASESGIGPQR